MDPRRTKVIGCSQSNDRLWILHRDGHEYPITEYNYEITGVDPALHALYPNDVHYGGNAYWVTGAFAERNGFMVEGVEDRR